MSNSAKRRLVAGAAGLAVLAGGGGAYAAGTTGTTAKPADRAAEQKAFLDDVAKRLNVTRDQLDAAVKGAAEARIDAAVAAGKLTKEQVDEAKQRLASGGIPLLGGGGPRGGGGPGFGHGGPGFTRASGWTRRRPTSASARTRFARSFRAGSRSRMWRRRRTRTWPA